MSSIEVETNNKDQNKFTSREFFLRKVEDLLDMTPTRIPRKLSAHIRRMKQNGDLEKAFLQRSVAFKDKSEKRIMKRLNEELERTILDIVETGGEKDATKKVENMAKAIWLLGFGGYLAPEDRLNDLKELVSIYPQVEDHLNKNMARIRDEAAAIELRSR